MAYITLNTDKLQENYQYLDQLFTEQDIQWSVVSKLLSGNELYLKTLLQLGINQICDSRLINLQTIKRLKPDVETLFIKPPAKRNARKIVEYADISCNTSAATVKALSQAAVALGKKHKIIIMVETGELREGVMPHNLLHFYDQVHSLPNIEVIGLGTNLTCMYGVLPSYDNLKVLEQWQNSIEATYNTRLDLLSGGASVTIPLVGTKELPAGINHFRVGESLFFGTDVYNKCAIGDMHQNLFTLYAEIIELHKKPNIPEGIMGYNLTGEKKEFEDTTLPARSERAIVDIGLLDVDTGHLYPADNSMRVAGASSDMVVVDLGNNAADYKVGDLISFRLSYMGVLRVMSSKYIEKRIESNLTNPLTLKNVAALN